MWAVQWVCEMYAAPISVVAELLGTSETNAYRVSSRWKSAGLVMSGRTIRPVPGPQWVVPTADTVTSLLGFHATKWIPGPKDARHLELTARVRIALAGNEPCVEDSWISERELRRVELNRAPAFGAGQRPHLHDGHWTDDLGRLHAIEVELTRKGSGDARTKVRAAYDAAKAIGAASLIYYAATSDVAARVTTAAKAVLRVPVPAGDPDFVVKPLDGLLDFKTDLSGPRGLVAAGGAA